MGDLLWPIKEWQLISNQRRNGTFYLPALAGLFAGSENASRRVFFDRPAESPSSATTRDQSVDSCSFNSISVSLENAGLYALRQSARVSAIGVEAHVNAGANYFSSQVKQLDFMLIQKRSAN